MGRLWGLEETSGSSHWSGYSGSGEGWPSESGESLYLDVHFMVLRQNPPERRPHLNCNTLFTSSLWFISDFWCLHFFPSNFHPFPLSRHGLLAHERVLSVQEKVPEVSTLHKELQQLSKARNRRGGPPGRSTPIGYPVPNGQPWKHQYK